MKNRAFAAAAVQDRAAAPVPSCPILPPMTLAPLRNPATSLRQSGNEGIDRGLRRLSPLPDIAGGYEVSRRLQQRMVKLPTIHSAAKRAGVKLKRRSLIQG